MSRRTPFDFMHYYDPDRTRATKASIEMYVNAYEEALLAEYKSGDIDVASYNEGQREAYEHVLVDLLGINPDVLAAYWMDPDQQGHPQPYADELPLLSDPDNWLITYEQVEQWSGQRLNRAQWESLNEAIPNSSIPEAINTIVANLPE